MRMRMLATFVGVILLTGACAESPSSGDPDADDVIDHVRGQSDLLLRVADEGGFVPADQHVRAIPSFSLFGDGTVIVPGAQIAIYPPPALPALFARPVSEDGIQALLGRAIDAGLTGPDRDLVDTGDVGIADASTTVFTLTTGGRSTTIRVYALGMMDSFPGLNPAQAALRRDLASLAADLGDLSWLPEGSMGEERPWEGGAGLVLIGPERRDPDLPQAAVRWPLPSELARLGHPVAWAEDTRCAVLDGDGWGTVRTIAERANELTPWRSGGHRYWLAIRPLLPDESGC
jgi:hypothetical protein